jgi:cholest-4-en-3-one 26-monooxygenase
MLVLMKRPGADCLRVSGWLRRADRLPGHRLVLTRIDIFSLTVDVGRRILDGSRRRALLAEGRTPVNRWAEVDNQLVNAEFYTDTGFHEVMKMLRHEDPVHWTQPASAERGFWSVTRYEDCLRMFDEPEHFSNRAGTHLQPNIRDLSDEERYKMGYDVQLVTMDPPEHEHFRRPINPHFSIPSVNKLREDCEQIVDELIADIAPLGRADAVDDLCALLPVRLFLTMLGIPESDWERVRTIALSARQPETAKFDTKKLDQTGIIAESFGRLYDYVAAHMHSRRGKSGDDFASVLANLKYHGEALGERATAWLGFSVVAGGLETTRNAAAIGILELIRRPEQAVLLQDEKVAASAVEEVLRWSNPSKNKLRVAIEDIEVGGQQIKKGDWIVAWIVSANRDETAFENPSEFNILRDPNPHLSLGRGEHHCLGRNVARLELRVLLQRLFATLPDLQVAGDFRWVASTNSTGLWNLPISFAPRTPAAI